MKNNKIPTVLHLADASSVETLTLLNHMAALGWRVHLISHHAPAAKFKIDPNVTIHRLWISPAYPLTYAAFLMAAPMIMSIKPDIIHAHYLTTFGIMAAVHRRFLRFKPMVLTTSGRDVLVDARSGMTRWSAEHALKMFEKITGGKDDIVKALRQMEAPEDRIEQIDWANGKQATAAAQLNTLYIELIKRRQ
ncbi:glycosyltransferase [Dehalogenimonas sp. WBC-2]|nr:glycosyltransferase [Dehalogenimonas sp. WBC-2]